MKSSSTQSNTTKATCRYYNSKVGCRFGENCRFSHNEASNSSQNYATKTSENTHQVDGGKVKNENTGNVKSTIKDTTHNVDYGEKITDHETGESKNSTIATTNQADGGKVKNENNGNQKITTKDSTHNVGNGGKCTDHENGGKENTSMEDTNSNVRDGGKAVPKNGETAEVSSETKVPAKKGKWQRPQCQFFMRGYCRNGIKCRFNHPWKLRKSTGHSIKGGGGSDNDGENTRMGVVNVKPVAMAKPRKVENCLSDLSEEEMKYLQDVEIEQLRKRFGNNVNVTEKEGRTFYSLKVEPSDPDWPYDIKEIQITVHFPSEYPKKIFEIEVYEDGDQFPDGFTTAINKFVAEYLREHEEAQLLRNTADLLFRPFLRWFDRNLEDLFTKALKQIKLTADARSAGLEFIPFQPKSCENDVPATAENSAENVYVAKVENLEIQDGVAPEYESKQVDSPTVLVEDNELCVEKGSSTVDNSAKSNETSTEAESVMFDMMKRKQNGVKKGTEVRFRGLELHENTATLQVTSLTFTVVCSRCKNREELPNVKENIRVQSTCQKCCNSLSIILTSLELVHQHSCTVAYINPQGCLPMDLILTDCVVLLGCLNCNKETSVKGLHYGSTKNIWCHHCHYKLEVKIDSTRFLQLQHDNENDKNVVTHQVVQQKKRVKDPPIKSGEALPENGTCKHYKKSFRWLRFPCCGKCFPCDKCHDENEDHEMEQATRMICGFCAKEQGFTQKGCISCKSSMTAVHTAHWEGGKGCRNKVKMSRGDNKKYSDTDKTISRHATKVQGKKKS